MCLAVPPNTIRAQPYALGGPGSAPQPAGDATASSLQASFEDKAITGPASASATAPAQPFFGLSMQSYEMAHHPLPQLQQGAPPLALDASFAVGSAFADLSPVLSAPTSLTTAIATAQTAATAPPASLHAIRPKARPSKNAGKRRRAAQRPGKTATDKARLFVQHDYHDLSLAPDAADPKAKGDAPGGAESFPVKLHRILEEADARGESHIISWQPHGRAFRIHDPRAFTDHVMARYFPKMRKITSLQRQFNLYGFERLTKEGPDRGAYYHEAFLRYRPALGDRRMVRRRVKGTGYKASGNPDAEPDLYSYRSMDEVVGKTGSGSLEQQVQPQVPVSSAAPSHPRAYVTESSSSNSSYASSGEESIPPNLDATQQMWLSCQNFLSPQPRSQAPPMAPRRNSLADLIEDGLLRDFFAANPAADATPIAPAGARTTSQAAPVLPPADHPILMEFADIWESASMGL
ncbi:hypothetical protein ACHAXT_005749 [Thalassiosira profunda]